jgi:PAS domain S-box-containing protein
MEVQDPKLAFDNADWWQSEWARFVVLAILGAAASYLSVNIPYTDVLIEGRWIFGYVGFAILNHWWMALLLACFLSLTRLYQLPVWTIFLGNMMYALPALLLIRFIHTRVLDRLQSWVRYGVAWLLMILLGYQIFTPVLWGFMAFLDGDPIWRNVLKGWREQPLFIESLLVGVISALLMAVIRSNAALRASRQELAITLYSIGDAVIATDVEGRIQRMNPMAEHLTGWREFEAQGKPLETVFCILNEETRELVEDPVEQVLKGGGVVGLADHTLLVARDGTERPVIDSAAPIRDENDLVSGVVLIFRDQTQERAVQRALEASHEQMAQILATVPAGVMLLDAEGRVLQANPTAESAMAVLAEAQVGDVLTHLGGRPLAELLTSPPTKGLWHEIEGEGRTFEAIARPVKRDPELEHWVLVVNDVTQEREVRRQLQQQERLAVVGQLAAGIAHDFNNIVATIVLYAHMMEQSGGLSDRDRERLTVISQQAWHASRLIDQILDFSRRAVLERQPLDLLPLLKEQVKLWERTLPEHITIELDYGQDKYTVHADPTRMQQMLANLAVNARDAMPGGGTLHIGLTRITVTPHASLRLMEVALRQAQDVEVGEWIRLTVSDTGTGIAPDVLPHIFEPFFTTKGPGEGSGLGLAQVYGIVKHHEGHIDVSTEVGQGTTFTVYLPAMLAQQSEIPTVEVQTLVQGQGETILVVEDEATLRRALVENLELLNYRVLEAADGREALEVLERSPPSSLLLEEKEGDCPLSPSEEGEGGIDLVLSDLVMPEMGGQALFQAMQARDLMVPVVILSGHPVQNQLDDLRAQGLAGWMLKPPDMEHLSQLLAQVLGRASEG